MKNTHQKNRVPRKAFILAAGFGSRIRPLSYDTPKPLMPLQNKPILEHSIDLLISWGVKEILINAHHAAADIIQFCIHLHKDNCRIQISFEPEILGTGGALRKAAFFFEDTPFWMINSDIAAQLDPAPIIRKFYKEKAIAALWMHDHIGPRTVEMRGNSITNFASKKPGTKNTFTFCGLQLLSPQIIDFLPKRNFSSIIEGYNNAMQSDQRVIGVTIKHATWADLGTRERYLHAHFNLFKANQSVFIGKNVSIEEGVTIKESVIWDGAKLCTNASIQNSIIGRHAIIRGEVEDSSAVNASALPHDVVLTQALRKLRTKPKNCTLIALPARGSNRSFERLLTPHRSAILIHYDAKARPENARYVSHTRLLESHNIRVPKVLLDMPQHSATLFEDAGTRTIEKSIKQLPPDQFITLYKKVIEQIAKLHSIPTETLKQTELEPPFSAELYRWERELFATHFLKETLELTKPKISQIMNELAPLADILQKEKSVLLHRDLQSSNILIKNNRPILIDFQGMRFGPAQYDLASLLFDPYIMLTSQQQNCLLEHYTKQMKNISASINYTVQSETFIAATVQRLAQVLGAFGRLARLPGMAHFKNHIPNACRMLERILKNTDTLPTLTKTLSTLSTHR